MKGDAGNAPAAYHVLKSAATMRPSFVAPILIQDFVSEPGPVARKHSSRVITILTDRPDFFDSIMATGSR